MVDAPSRTPEDFVSRWKGAPPSPKVAEDYVGLCRTLPFVDESLFMEVVSILKENIESWALEHSRIYTRSRPFYCKEHMDDKSSWYVPRSMEDSVETHTSGSTTGFHFFYRRMKSTFNAIEWDNHYDMVLDEFGVRQNPDILYFFSDNFKKQDGSVVFCEDTPQPYMNSHGRSRLAKVHYANFDMYKSDPELFFKGLFAYLSERRMDVFFSAGPQVNSMCHYIRRLDFQGRLANLLSQTNERLLQEDARFLFVENSHFGQVCDHMRCWDGGASFFTCREGNYHLMDNLSWCEEIGGRLVSTDYFNFASPFVKYWSGDVCRIGRSLSRCDCGRLYREFEFVDNRPFSLRGVCLRDLKERMLSLGIPGIKQVRCYADSVNVVSSRALSEIEKSAISSLESRFSFVFSVES